MATQLPDITSRVRLDTSDLNAGVKRAKDQGTKTGQALGSTIGTYAKVGLAVAAVGVGKFMSSSISAASDLNESLSKTRVVFGSSSAEMEKFASTSAKSMGVSTQATLEATSTLGNLFVSLKIGQKPAAEMSQKMVTLASDLASFNNVSPEEALLALRSGLVGETEPLRKFGVNMNDATLKAQALKMGLIETVKDALTPAAKAQAAYGLILEQTGTAQGDFARTSDGLANQQRILSAQFSDAKAKLGQELLPAAVATAHVFTEDVIPAFSKTVGFIAANKDAIVPLVTVLGGLAGALYAAVNAQKAYAAVRAKLALVNPVMVAGTIAATGATLLYVKAQRENAKTTAAAKAEADEFVKSLDFSTTSLAQNQTGLDALKGKLLTSSEAFVQATDTSDITSQAYLKQAKVLAELGPVYEAQRAATDRLKSNQATLAVTYGLTIPEVEKLAAANNVDLTGSLDNVSRGFGAAVTAAQATHNPLKQVAANTADLGSKATTASEQVTALKTSLDLLAGKSLSTDQALITFRNGIADLTAKLKESKGSLSLNTQAGRDARAQFITTAQGALSYAASVKESTGSTDKARAALKAAIVQLKATGGGSQFAKDKLKELEAAYKSLAPSAREAGKNIGLNLTGGIVDSINGQRPNVVKVATAMGDAAARGATRGATVDSPAKATLYAGRMLGEGFIVSMRKMQTPVGVAAATLGASAIPRTDKAYLPRMGLARHVDSGLPAQADGGNAALLAEIRLLRREMASHPERTASGLGGVLNGGASSAAHRARTTVWP